MMCADHSGRNLRDDPEVASELALIDLQILRKLS